MQHTLINIISAGKSQFAKWLRKLKPTSGKVLINGLNIESNKISVLNKINFISPYIELPKKLKVKQNLFVYGKLYKIDKRSIRPLRDGDSEYLEKLKEEADSVREELKLI